MKLIITTLLVYFSLLTFSNNKLKADSLFESQILSIGKKYEKKGEYKKAFETYENYLKSNAYSEKITEKKNRIKHLVNNDKKYKNSSTEKVYAIQVLTTNIKYKKAVERDKKKFEKYGLKCYLKEGRNLYLRCNPSKNRKDLNYGISILKKRGKDYFVVRDNIKIFAKKEAPIKTIILEKKIVQPKIDKPITKIVAKPKRNNLNPRDPRNKSQSKNIHKSKGGKSKFSANQGYKALNSKQLKKAKEIFADILKYSPKNIDASFGYALAFMNEGNWVKAYITLGKIVKLTDRKDIQTTYKAIKYNMNLKKGWKNVATNPKKSVEFFKRAQEVENTADVAEGLAYAYSNNKEFGKAIPEAKKLYRQKKDFKSANFLIDAYLKGKENDNARAFFDSLDPTFQVNMKYNPKRAELLAEAKQLLDEKHYHQAKSLLRELYLMYPTNMTVLLYFAKVYEAEKRYKNSLEYYRTILAKDTKHKEAFLGISRIYIETGKYSEALQTLSKMKEPTKEIKSMINDTKLKLYVKNGRTKEALNLGKEMLLEDPINTKLYVTLGDLNIKLKKNRDAYFYYGRAFQLEPNNFEIRIKLLTLLLAQNLFDQTQTLLGKFNGFHLNSEQRKELRDFYVKFYKKYTAVSLEEQDYEYALKGAKAGMQMEPNDTFFIESGGWAGLNSKKYNDAIFYFSKIIAKDPKNYTIRYGIGLAYVNLKQFDKAKAYFKTAEKSNDVDLLYKIAEIYKDIGFKKDSYRVIKLIEELGRMSVIDKPITAGNGNAPLTSSASMTPISANLKQVDDMNTYNPFIIGGNNYSTPIIRDTAPQQLSESLPQIIPEPTYEIEVKKKSGSNWF